jgi:ferredoxin
MGGWIHRTGWTAFLFVEERGRDLFKKGENPFHFLGAFAFFLFWILLLTGIYLIFFYRLGIEEAYTSVRSLMEDQPYLGGIARSLHRYAADGLMIAMILHGLRVFLRDQYRGARWLAWVSGIILLVFIWGEGILGYVMVWDDRAQFAALTSAEFLNILPVFGAVLPRAFLSPEATTNIFFLIIIALHIVVPLGLLVFLWVHVSRTSRPVITPPYRFLTGIALGLVILSLIKPASSGPPADPSRLPIHMPLDWFYFAPYPLMTGLPPGTSWAMFGIGLLLLGILPWFSISRRPLPAAVQLNRCNACARCYEDCPYEAISMDPRTDGRPYDREAVVHPEKCVSCGICIGSCSTAALALPGLNFTSLRKEISKRLSTGADVEKNGSVLVFLCEKAIPSDVIRQAAPMADPIPLPCIGALHGMLVEHVLRDKPQQGIFLIGCPEGDCHDRLGYRWLEERLRGEREPHPKTAVDFARIHRGHYSLLGAGRVAGDIEQFRRTLPDIEGGGKVPVKYGMSVTAWMRNVIGVSLVLGLPIFLIGYFSEKPSYSFFKKEESLLIVSMKYISAPRHCRELSDEEIAQRPAHMRVSKECSRERWPVMVRLEIDGQSRLNQIYAPTGLWSDGAAYVYQKLVLTPGLHAITLHIQEVRERQESGILLSRIENFKPGYAVILEPGPSYVEVSRNIHSRLIAEPTRKSP